METPNSRTIRLISVVAHSTAINPKRFTLAVGPQSTPVLFQEGKVLFLLRDLATEPGEL